MRALRSICLAAALLCACGSDSHGGGGGGPSLVSDASIPCTGTLDGLTSLQDAGFTCQVAVISNLDGGGASISLVAAGALPLPVIGLGAVILLPHLPDAGGALPNLDGGADAGDGGLLPDGGLADGGVFDAGPPPDAGSYAIPGDGQGSASIQLFDSEAYGMDTKSSIGRGRLTFSYMPDAGVVLDGTLAYAAHGTITATMPFEFSNIPDAGPDGGPDGGPPVDAGTIVKLIATF